jgi:predicted nucleic acid-binding protein
VSAYLDASALVATLVREPNSAAVDTFLEHYDGALGVSEFAAAEVASALFRLVRTHLIAQEDAEARLSDFDAWRSIRTEPIDIEPSDARLANAYVRRFDLTLRAPDALHAAICRRLDLTLVTLDQRLARAARELGIEVRVPGG